MEETDTDSSRILSDDTRQDSPKNIKDDDTNGDLTETTWDGWEELMGKDLMMFRMDETIENNENAIESEYSSEKQCLEAEHGDAVVISYKGYCLDEEEYNDPFFWKKKCNVVAPFVDCKEQLILLGDGDISPGLELGCRFLKKNQSAWIKCHFKYGFGASSRRGDNSNSNTDTVVVVPPFTPIAYHVTIRTIIPATDVKFASADFQILLAYSKKQMGNDIYQHEWQNDATDGGSGKTKCLRLYRNGADRMINLLKEIRETKDNDDDDTHNQNKEELDMLDKKALHVLLDCLNNISAVHYKAKDYGKAKEAATTVLQWDVTNSKALCRAARAALFDPAGSFEESEAAIQAAEQLYPNDSQIESIRKLWKKKKQQYKDREKAMYGGKIKISKPIPSSTQKPDTSNHQDDDDKFTKPADGSTKETAKEKENSISMNHTITSIILLTVATLLIKVYVLPLLGLES